MQRVRDLYDQLAKPGAQKLFQEAKKRGIAVSRSQVTDFVRSQAERQVFSAPLPKAQGKSVSEDVGARFQIDVVNYQSGIMALVLVNVFTRKFWAKTIPNKSAESVLAAGKVLINRLEEKPKVVSTDDGLEYTTLSQWLKEQQIGHKQSTADTDKQALSILDRAVQDTKARFSRILASTGRGEEREKLERAIKAHNNSLHSSIHGTPNDVSKSDSLVFLNLVDQAAKITHNTQLLDKRTAALEATGAFRRPLPGVTKQAFRRGYQAKYDKKETVQDIEGSTITAQDGSQVDIKLLQVVDPSSGQPRNIDEENARTQKKRDALYPMVEVIAEFIQGREVSLRALALHLAKQRFDLDGQQKTYKELLRSQSLLGFGALADAIRLFPSMLKITQAGYAVKRA